MRPVCGVLGVAAGLLATLYALAVCTTRGQFTEDAAVLGSDSLHPDPLWAQSALAAIAADSSLFIAMAAVVLLGWRQRRFTVGAVAAATMLAANITTQVLKNLVFVRPDLVVNPEVGTGNSLPSGTVTFLLSTALGLVMVLPRSPASFLLPGAAIAVGCATITLNWHRPADVLAGVAVVVGWFVIARSTLDRRYGPGHTVRDWRPAAIGLTGCGAVSLLPLAAVIIAPTFPLGGTAHGSLVYVFGLVVVAVGSVLAVAPLPALMTSEPIPAVRHHAVASAL